MKLIASVKFSQDESEVFCVPQKVVVKIFAFFIDKMKKRCYNDIATLTK